MYSFLLGTVVANTFLLQREYPGRILYPRASSESQWIRQLCASIFDRHKDTGNSRKTRGRPRHEPEATTVPLEEHKRVGKCPQRRCYACTGRSISSPKRRALGAISGNSRAPKTRFACETCDVPLCNTQHCWDRYHS
ncbi:uncharacterized protein VDAG_09179 [Verticillium dahliae VdLs.17]|uniref:PiggyBac transposable element-derived protein 4 C-terminal zinc-ribbon domain-containing protein n=1 Tax=Verticillium dahliae (strain VdLs.17 / ATCC MYA-4575 / FGSC 10137) TaxID=498257 RepID=G2XFQ5_VERDV|nr:uncharacterized protein VDAG_09179 [Verticillium dahliae VdLs.17]EGY18653.1 hypothetical protein VDAG_09179 [Verticillium dahliae VdLs.17]